MCLTIFSHEIPKVQIAEEDIEVYKILFNRGKEWASPYRGQIYDFDIEITSKLGVPEPDHEVYNYNIEQGLHTYANLDDALYNRDSMNSRHLSQNPFTDTYYEVFKAIIPKGSEYFKGKFVFTDSYASNKLMVISRKT